MDLKKTILIKLRLLLCLDNTKTTYVSGVMYMLKSLQDQGFNLKEGIVDI